MPRKEDGIITYNKLVYSGNKHETEILSILNQKFLDLLSTLSKDPHALFIKNYVRLYQNYLLLHEMGDLEKHILLFINTLDNVIKYIFAGKFDKINELVPDDLHFITNDRTNVLQMIANFFAFTNNRNAFDFTMHGYFPGWTTTKIKRSNHTITIQDNIIEKVACFLDKRFYLIMTGTPNRLAINDGQEKNLYDDIDLLKSIYASLNLMERFNQLPMSKWVSLIKNIIMDITHYLSKNDSEQSKDNKFAIEKFQIFHRIISLGKESLLKYNNHDDALRTTILNIHELLNEIRNQKTNSFCLFLDTRQTIINDSIVILAKKHSEQIRKTIAMERRVKFQ